MKLFQSKIAVFPLLLGFGIGLQALEHSIIMQRAQLVTLVDERNVEQFKKHIDDIVGQHLSQQSTVLNPVIDYIKIAQAQKTAQLAKNKGRSKKVAAAKAAFCGVLSASAVAAQLGMCYDWLADLNRIAHKTPAKKSNVELFAYFHYLCMPALAYSSMSWTYEQAQFARYGDSLLLSDIVTLDEMLSYVQSVA